MSEEQGPDWMFCTRDLVVTTVQQSKAPKAIPTGTGQASGGGKPPVRAVRRTPKRRR